MVQRGGYWIIFAFMATAAAKTAVESIGDLAAPAEELIRVRCPDPNSHWTDWAATCENTCARPDNAIMCKPGGPVAGCICNEGYLKDENGKCQCAKVCVTKCKDPNSHWSYLSANCQNTCENPTLSLTCESDGDKAGCVCNEGYLINEKGECQPVETCIKPVCKDPNSHWTNTGATGCQNTCENPSFASMCRPDGPRAGCICNKGYLPDKNGICQNAECCGFCKDPNAHYSSSLANGCHNTCEEPERRWGCASLVAGAGCICNEPDFVLNSDGRCVRLWEC